MIEQTFSAVKLPAQQETSNQISLKRRRETANSNLKPNANSSVLSAKTDVVVTSAPEPATSSTSQCPTILAPKGIPHNYSNILGPNWIGPSKFTAQSQGPIAYKSSEDDDNEADDSYGNDDYDDDDWFRYPGLQSKKNSSAKGTGFGGAHAEDVCDVASIRRIARIVLYADVVRRQVNRPPPLFS